MLLLARQADRGNPTAAYCSEVPRKQRDLGGSLCRRSDIPCCRGHGIEKSPAKQQAPAHLQRQLAVRLFDVPLAGINRHLQGEGAPCSVLRRSRTEMTPAPDGLRVGKPSVPHSSHVADMQPGPHNKMKARQALASGCVAQRHSGGTCLENGKGVEVLDAAHAVLYIPAREGWGAAAVGTAAAGTGRRAHFSTSWQALYCCGSTASSQRNKRPCPLQQAGGCCGQVALSG